VRAYALEANQDPFHALRGLFAKAVEWLGGDESAGLAHGDLETQIATRFWDLARQAVQDHLDLRAADEQILTDVVDAEAVPRGRVETGRERVLATVFGAVVVDRLAYRQRGCSDLHPADAVLNLPLEMHSHGLRRLAAVEATRGSFGQAVEAIGRATRQRIGKRQVEALTVRAASDVEGFYDQRRPQSCADGVVLAMSADAKGVVMRREALRETTAKAQASKKLTSRLSAGEKSNRKRMAEVVSVFDSVPAVRTADDILPAADREVRPGPATSGGWPRVCNTKRRRSSPPCSPRPPAATPNTNGPGSAYWTATPIRSTGSTPKPERATSPSRSLSTSSTCSNTSGARPGVFTPEPTRRPRPGSTTRLGGS
jgi:hypothetical protein